uniref:Putative fasciclin-like arabinogalactan protein 12 n=1 Tax=Davidia involucrata TaxID=16924 RepID=A0A5B7BJE1_DAVIN
MFLLVIFLLHFTSISAQSPALAPLPSGPPNLVAILQKASGFNTFIRLLKSTHVEEQITSQLISSNQGMTIFAPGDNAFANLASGMLNSLGDSQKVELMQFHVLPNFLPLSQFQTVSNPLRTQAGNGPRFPLNVTVNGNSVNMTTAIVNASVTGTIYSDKQIAVYQVDKVLLPYDIFGPPAPAEAPAPAAKPKTKPPQAPSRSSASVVSSASTALIYPALIAVSFMVSVIAAFS